MANHRRSVNATGPRCSVCKQHLSWEAFDKDASTALGIGSSCRTCKKTASQRYKRDPDRLRAAVIRRKTDPKAVARDKRSRAAWISRSDGMIYILWYSAKVRAKAKGLTFGIDPTDVVIPAVCPLLGTRIVRGVGKMHAGSPSLDRIDPALGYVPGNVWVISYRANAIKQNASLAELETLVTNLRQCLQTRR